MKGRKRKNKNQCLVEFSFDGLYYPTLGIHPKDRLEHFLRLHNSTKMELMKHFQLRSFLLPILIAGITVVSTETANAVLPVPDHVVICVMENHGYSQIIGSSAAPFINSLASSNASFGASYALTHPSQPNYLMLFSGSNQGVTTDNLPTGTPWSTANLGGSLINAGLTFTAYSQSLPAVGSTVTTFGQYARKHAPWVDWQGTGTNEIPAVSNQPFTAFPSNYSTLPTVSFVIPDMDHDMHNGTDPGTITTGDTWLQTYLSGYITWANTHNSLFILTFDEDENSASTNQIVTVFSGQMVQPGYYSTITYNHYNILKTIEEMYGLPYAGASVAAQTITECWIQATGIGQLNEVNKIFIAPNPIASISSISFSGTKDFSALQFEVYDLIGNKVRDLTAEFIAQRGNMIFNREGLTSGIYFYKLLKANSLLLSGKIVIE